MLKQSKQQAFFPRILLAAEMKLASAQELRMLNQQSNAYALFSHCALQLKLYFSSECSFIVYEAEWQERGIPANVLFHYIIFEFESRFISLFPCGKASAMH